jgi:hypothetical protein
MSCQKAREVTLNKYLCSVLSDFSKTAAELTTFSKDCTQVYVNHITPSHTLITDHDHTITQTCHKITNTYYLPESYHYLYILITTGQSHPYAYHCPWSKYCLSSSIGGCAPYISFAGMFISSTNIIHLVFFGGPYKPFLRLCNFEMTSS